MELLWNRELTFFSGDQTPLPNLPLLELQGFQLPLPALPIRLRRRALLIFAQRRTILPVDDTFLLGRDRLGSRVPPLTLRGLQGPQTGEPASRPSRTHRHHRLWFRQGEPETSIISVLR